MSEHPRLGDVAREIASDVQSAVVDLIMVRRLVRRHADDAELVDNLDARLEPMMKDVRRAEREAFRRKPRDFARMLVKVARGTEPLAAD